MKTATERLRENHEKRGALIAQLELWAQVSAQGFNPDDVEALTFNPALVPAHVRRRSGDHQNPYGFPVRIDEHGRSIATPTVFNVIVLKDGRRIPLTQEIKAAPKQ